MCCQGRPGAARGVRETPGSSGHPVSSGYPSPVDTTGSWSYTYGEGEDCKCLFGNGSPTCVRPFSSTRGSLLTSQYPQGDAARMGAPGEKGPNGLPVSMAAGPVIFGVLQQLGLRTEILPGERGGSFCALSQKGPHLSQEEMQFSHHTNRGTVYKMERKTSGVAPNTNTVIPWLLATLALFKI